MKASDVLMAAKWKILEDGWWRGGDSDSNEGQATCTVLAIDASVDVHLIGEEWCAASDGALDYIKKVTGVDGNCEKVYDWNDAPERTLPEVLDAFDEAIRLAKEAENLEGAAP